MPFKVLSQHFKELKRVKENYIFEDFDLDEKQKEELIDLFIKKLNQKIDKTGIRKILESYNDRKKGCVFCDISKNKIVKSNELAVVIKDDYPVTKHHCLIIPKRHCSDYFDLYQPEINAISQLINEMKTEKKKKDKTIKGFNIGNNSGEVAGQTIPHCHIHLIPRRKGDTDNPRGGVRGVIKDKQSY